MKNKFLNTPVSSYGLLAFIPDYHQPYNEETLKVLSFRKKEDYRLLMIQRRNTMGYTDFIRGRYFCNSTDIVRRYLEEMTREEREKIKTMDFDSLWNDLWHNHHSRHYKNDKKTSMSKYLKLDIATLLAETESKYKHAEFGIPKGRKNKKETEIQCAMREFEEETGYGPQDYTLLSLPPLEENFLGTNNIYYRHVYYFALMKEGIQKIGLDPRNKKQAEEVKNLDFFYLQDCLKITRDYDLEKRKIITEAFERIKGFKIETVDGSNNGSEIKK